MSGHYGPPRAAVHASKGAILLHTSAHFRHVRVSVSVATGTRSSVTPDTQERTPVACDHLPPTIVRVRTERGYRIRCLKCGTVGPEREDPTSAWAALLSPPYLSNRS